MPVSPAPLPTPATLPRYRLPASPLPLTASRPRVNRRGNRTRANHGFALISKPLSSAPTRKARPRSEENRANHARCRSRRSATSSAPPASTLCRTGSARRSVTGLRSARKPRTPSWRLPTPAPISSSAAASSCSSGPTTLPPPPHAPSRKPLSPRRTQRAAYALRPALAIGSTAEGPHFEVGHPDRESGSTRDSDLSLSLRRQER